MKQPLKNPEKFWCILFEMVRSSCQAVTTKRNTGDTERECQSDASVGCFENEATSLS
jgi:hypothetical protein